MKSTYFFALLLLSIFSLSSCDDQTTITPSIENETIPEPTVEAYMQGELFTTSDIVCIKNTEGVNQINATSANGAITLGLTTRQVGIYYIGGTEENYIDYSFAEYNENESINENYSSKEETSATGIIEILSLDLENNIISGTFEGTIISKEDKSKVYTIENGKFENIKF